MTKEEYLNVCEALGTEPLEEEIPVEHSDLLIEVQQALNVYHTLQDNWDTMSGTYMGKNLSSIMDMFILMGIDLEDRRTLFELIGVIDNFRSVQLSAKKSATVKPP